jgi:predicted phosphodiesterase
MSSGFTTKERIKEIVEHAINFGDESTLETFNIKSASLIKYKNIYARTFGKDSFKRKQLLSKINEKFNEDELLALVNGKPLHYAGYQKPIIDFDGDSVKFGVISDTHYGSIFFDEIIHQKSIEIFQKENISFIIHAGDVSEGMSKRDGHVYELSHIGYSEQKRYSIEKLKEYQKPIYAIDGNHDRWFKKSNGADLCEDIAKEIPDFYFLGHDEGVIKLKNGSKIGVWHGEDGSSYALSYRLQKKVESFQGGDKPSILLAGHDHKAGYFFIRNVHCLAAGSIQKQTAFMKAKRLEAYVGFWICEAWLGQRGISKFQQCFYSFYFE